MRASATAAPHASRRDGRPAPLQSPPVPRSEASVEIDRPAAEVFGWLLDRERRLRWVDGLEASESLDAGDPAVGSRFRETLSQHGLNATVETTIAELDPPRRITLVVDARGLHARTETTLAEAGGRTRVVSALDATARGMAGRLVAGVVARQAQGSLERSLARLKALVEAG